MTLDDYKVVLYRNHPEGWVAEVPAISGCYALMPTKEDALRELEHVFEVTVESCHHGGFSFPWRARASFFLAKKVSRHCCEIASNNPSTS